MTLTILLNYVMTFSYQDS